MVPRASAYRWSSHNGNSGRIENKLLTRHPEYLALSRDEALRQVAYQQLFDEGDTPAFLAAIREAANGGFPLVGERLKSQVAAMGRQVKPRKPGPPPAQTEQSLDLLSRELGL
jgi:hypothetical protein